MQVSWAAQGLQSTNSAAPIVAEYSNKKMLQQLGYTFNVDDLTYFEVECYNIIEAKLAKLKKPKNTPKKKKR